ncbi:hypothetical protein PIB30_090275, partial [Stylosanthes scabra]|nr:hypothetical protein [Stylosanthes scabra]
RQWWRGREADGDAEEKGDGDGWRRRGARQARVRDGQRHWHYEELLFSSILSWVWVVGNAAAA